jgi:hypothetical protein
MSKNNDEFDIFDPTGMLKTMRNDNMDALAKMWVQFVNTDAYADATGKVIDAWLCSSAPFRKMLENTMTKSLANLSMPSRDEVTRVAERLTNVEMRLDDMDAKLDELLAAARNTTRAENV